MTEDGKLWYAVVYSKDGTIHLWKGSSKDDCESKLMRILRNKRCHDLMKRTTIIKRDAKGMTEDCFIFGCPESLNVLGKFDRLLKKGKESFIDD